MECCSLRNNFTSIHANPMESSQAPSNKNFAPSTASESFRPFLFPWGSVIVESTSILKADRPPTTTQSIVPLRPRCQVALLRLSRQMVSALLLLLVLHLLWLLILLLLLLLPSRWREIRIELRRRRLPRRGGERAARRLPGRVRRARHCKGGWRFNGIIMP